MNFQNIWLYIVFTKIRTACVYCLGRMRTGLAMLIAGPIIVELRQRISDHEQAIQEYDIELSKMDDLIEEVRDEMSRDYVEKSDLESLQRDHDDLEDTVNDLDRDVADQDRKTTELAEEMTEVKASILELEGN